MKQKLINIIKEFKIYETNLMLTLLILFTGTFFIYKDFGIRMIFGYAILWLFILFNIFVFFKKKEYPHFTIIKLIYISLTIILIFQLIRPSVKIDMDLLSYIIAIIISAAFILFIKTTKTEIYLALKVCNYIAMAFSIYVIFFIIFKDSFSTTIYPFLSTASQEYLDHFVQRGYSIVIGGSATYTDYIIFLGIACSVGTLNLSNRSKQTKLKYSALIAFYLLVLLLIGRRGEFLAATLTLSFLYIISGEGKIKRKRLIFVVGICIVVLVLILLTLPYLKNIDFLRRYIMTIEQMLNGNDITSGRTQLYQWAIEIFKDNPIFGVGWTNFSYHITDEFRALHGMDVNNVHNIYLQFLCETGIVGTILIMSPLIYLYFQTIKQTIRITNKKCEDGIAIMLNYSSLSIQTFFMIVGLLDPCFTKLIFWNFYCIAIIFLNISLTLEGHIINDFITRKIESGYKKLIGKFKRKENI